ncbi:hypothetical protein D9M71_771560 [compost metagenome]
MSFKASAGAASIDRRFFHNSSDHVNDLVALARIHNNLVADDSLPRTLVYQALHGFQLAVVSLESAAVTALGFQFCHFVEY